MRYRGIAPLSLLPPALLLALIAFVGCAAQRSVAVPTAGTEGAGVPKAREAGEVPHGTFELPEMIEISLSLSPGQSWKSVFVSTSEMKRTLAAAEGKKTEKSMSVGLELVATQEVKEVTGGLARIEVRETSARILQEGRFLEPPFRQFAPPNPVHFTVNTATGATDFSEMEKAYADWMEGVKTGPVGEILGKTFRLRSYVAQLKELYGRPFTRFAGKTLSRESHSTGGKDFVLPFLGPGAAIGPVPVEFRSRYETLDVGGGRHLLRAAGEYAGSDRLTAEEAAARLADFGLTAPASLGSETQARGTFTSTVDILSGREVRSVSRLVYTATVTFDGGKLTEEIRGESTLEPAD